MRDLKMDFFKMNFKLTYVKTDQTKNPIFKNLNRKRQPAKKTKFSSPKQITTRYLRSAITPKRKGSKIRKSARKTRHLMRYLFDPRVRI